MSLWKELIRKQKKERIELVQSALKEHNNQSEAARYLGISRQQINQFLNQHQIGSNSDD